MFNLIEIIPPSGDCIAGYRVDLDRDYTVAEFIEHVLQFRENEGSIRINNAGLELEYKNGTIIKNELTPDISSLKIKEVTAFGKCSTMDYYIIIKKPSSRKKNTNFVARELKEAIFEEIEKGPFKGRIRASRMEGTGEPEYWKEYVEAGFLIVKRYLELCGFKKVEYIRKIENFNIWFALFFDYEEQREVILPPIELHPGTTKDLLPR